MDIPFLPPGDFRFPDPRPFLNRNDGLTAVSADLSVPRLLSAYRRGIFPWFAEQGCFYWFATAPRTVLPPSSLHIGRSLRKTLRSRPYLVSRNRDFPAVIEACARSPRPGQDGTWIGPEFRRAYTELHRSGHAHSFECWYPAADGTLTLAGGFYGVQIGRVFFGESMFAAQADASKIAFAHAVPHLAECGIGLIDCQQDTPHLARFGSRQIPFDDFQAALSALTGQELLQPLHQKMLIGRGMDIPHGVFEHPPSLPG